VPANENMIALWNGEDAASWHQHAERYDAMLKPLGEAALAAAKLSTGEAVLDVGCGAGALTLAAATTVGSSGRAVGVDLSQPLVEVARRRAAEAGIEHVTFETADAQVDALVEVPVDAVVSRFGVMFFDDPVAAFVNIRSATTPGGRLSFVCWQPMLENEWAIVAAGAVVPHLGMPELPGPDAPGPFAFGDRDRVAQILGDAGWTSVTIDDFRVPITVGGARTVEEAITYFREDLIGKAMFRDADDERAAVATDALREALEPHVTPEGVRLGSATWIVTATAP